MFSKGDRWGWGDRLGICDRKAIEAFYPETLPNSLMSPNSFLVAALEFSTCGMVSSTNGDSVYTWKWDYWIIW